MSYTVFHSNETGGRVVTAATIIAAKVAGRGYRSEGHAVTIQADFKPPVSLEEFERLHPDSADL